MVSSCYLLANHSLGSIARWFYFLRDSLPERAFGPDQRFEKQGQFMYHGNHILHSADRHECKLSHVLYPDHSLTRIQILYLVPFYVQVSGKGTVMAGGVLNTLFSFGELMGWLTCILIRTWKLETRYFLTTSRFTALASVVILSFANGGKGAHQDLLVHLHS
jgi:hypothetical protein